MTRSKRSAGSSAASLGGIWICGVVVGHVEAPEGLDGAVDRGGDLVLVADVAGEGEDLVPGVGEFLRGRVQGRFVDVGEGDGGPGLGERAGGRQAHRRRLPR